jgi:TPR repeat protein
MGQCLERGWACFHNEKEALKRFKEAAARGHPESEVRYAFHLETGKAGQRRDTAEALKFYRRAAEHEDREGMFN